MPPRCSAHESGGERSGDFERVGLAVNFCQLLADRPLIIGARIDEQYGDGVGHAAASIARETPGRRLTVAQTLDEGGARHGSLGAMRR